VGTIVALTALALVVATFAPACGGSSERLPPAAEPASSPPLEREPEGTVVHLGRRPGRPPEPRVFIATTADRRYAGVIRPRERELEVFDTETLESEGKVSIGIGPTQLVGGGRRFFVVDTRGNALLEVRLDPLRVHRRTHVGGTPYGLAFDPERRRYWVALTARNEVVELTDRRVLRRFPTVRQPDSVAVDPGSGRVFVASARHGTLQFFDPPPCRNPSPAQAAEPAASGVECDRR
jgi:hypothetical protein